MCALVYAQVSGAINVLNIEWLFILDKWRTRLVLRGSNSGKGMRSFYFTWLVRLRRYRF